MIAIPFCRQAIGKFPAVCGYVGKEDKSDAICRKTLATMFAHFAQETGNHNPSDKEYEEWRQVRDNMTQLLLLGKLEYG